VKDVVIVGGGLAGLISSTLLARNGLDVLLVEKKAYPFHRVCGEYISNEVIPFLQAHGLYPEALKPINISQFRLTAVNGRSIEMPLDLGGFGISRYALDQFLYQQATQAGVTFRLNSTVEQVAYQGGHFAINLKGGQVLHSRLVVGAHGKRSRLDAQLERPFFGKRTDYIGVKYHIEYQGNANEIALHNFNGGYCGISQVENGHFNMCYLGRRSQLRQHGNVDGMEAAILAQNPHLKYIFENSRRVWAKPLVINEISFHAKQPVEGHMLMAGDSAGLITPLCGNGMALAIHGARQVVQSILQHYTVAGFNAPQRAALEKHYARQWRQLFARRLWAGRRIQALFGSAKMSNMAVNLGKYTPGVARFLMSKTHGKPMQA